MVKPGDSVVVEVPHQFRGRELGIVVSISKENLPYVWLINDKLNPRYALVDVERGDYIRSISKA